MVTEIELFEYAGTKAVRIASEREIHSFIYIKLHSFIHSFSILSDDRSKASSKTIPPHSAI